MKVWLEKALLKGAFYRQSPDFAFGKALVSPSESETGSDVYFQLRQVMPGDVVLHLTENTAIIGRSVAAAKYNEVRVRGTTWYRVPLNAYAELKPVFPREWFFEERYRPRLLAIIDSGQRWLFYTRRYTLMQGRYLTEIPSSLLEVLDESYLDHTGQKLV